MKARANQRKSRDSKRIRRAITRHSHSAPVSSHPEIEEEIEQVDGGLDASRIKLDMPRPAVKPIVSVDGRDVEDGQIHDDRAA